MLFERRDEVTAALAQAGLDAWLIYDFRGLNPLAEPLLGLNPETLATRRLAACFRADGTVRTLVHAIEQSALPGRDDIERRVYRSRKEFWDGLSWLIGGCDRVAAEYSHKAANPYVSFVDAGTIDLVRLSVEEVVSSGDLVQQFQAVWTEQQWQSHREAEAITTAAFPMVWQFVADQVRHQGGVEERAVERLILDHFAAHNLLPGHPPIVATGVNGGLPHYETGTGERTIIREGDVLLVDLWGRLNQPETVYSDLTRMAFVGATVPDRVGEVFGHVAAARDASIQLLKDRFAAGEPVAGWEVDRVGRDVIEVAGFGDFFTHRTGHSIGTELHGSGAHMDDLEIRETRRVLPGTGFSIEPGIYLPDPADGGFGIRSEVNVFIGFDGEVHVTGGPVQAGVECLLA